MSFGLNYLYYIFIMQGWQGDKVIRLLRKEVCQYEDKKVHARIILRKTKKDF